MTARTPPTKVEKMVNLAEYLKKAPETKETSPEKKVSPEKNIVESKKARRQRAKADAKKYEELKREVRMREAGGQDEQ